MSKWYFTTGGLLMSSEARDDYFRLARAVTKAFLSETLLAPDWNEYAKSINDKKMEKYRVMLELSLTRKEEEEWCNEKKESWYKESDQRIESWDFGMKWPETKIETVEISSEDSALVRDACAFKDYILLQTVSSRLRSALTEDIRSRRRPLA